MSFVFMQRNIAANWGKILLLGGLYVLLGVVALSYVGLTTLFSITLLGVMLAVAGVGEILFGIQTRKEGSLGFHVVFGLCAIIAGAIMFLAPVTNALIITLAAAIYLVARGVVKMIGSAVMRYPFWAWTFWDGLLSLCLGGLIISMWPASSFWAIGIFVGVELVTHGVEFLSLGFMGRRIVEASEAATSSNKENGDDSKLSKTVATPSKSNPKVDKDLDHFY